MAVVGVATALAPMPSDTWWHLRAGADIVRSHTIELTDRYSHTAYGLPWPNHEWLSQVVLYGAFRMGGLPLVSLLAAGLIAAAWALVWRLCSGAALQRLAVVGLLLIPASLHWAPRPQAFSLVFLAVAISLVVANRVWWLPPLFFIWANSHGAVVLGFVVITAALAAAVVDDRRQWRRYALVLAACAAAATLTPLGIAFWTEIPASMARIRQYPIDEWRPPAIAAWPMAPFWIAALAVFAGTAVQWRSLLSADHRRTRIMCAGTLVAMPLAMTAVRNIGPFAMLAAPALCGLLEMSSWRARAAARAEPSVEHPAINLAALAGTASIAVLTIAMAFRQQIPRLGWTPLPAASLQALDRCPENLYNRYDEGGYLIWFAPGHRVFLDGRQDPYPVPLIRDHLSMEQSGDYRATFARYQIHCAYLPAASPVSMNLESAGWTALYRDRQWVVLTQ